MKPDDYCISICGGKCCTLHTENPPLDCQYLTEDKKCSIYKERFASGKKDEEAVFFYWNKRKEFVPFICGRIKHLLATNQVPQHIAEGCCYAHPELLLEEKLNHG